jgi:hypothetical protein
MPTFSLGRLGRIQISRLPPSHTSCPTTHQNPPSAPPPEYVDVVETDMKNYAPLQARPPQCKIEQVRRFLVEILAMTFGANFDELNAALYNISPPSGTNTILCDSERADLLALSNLVRKVHGCFLRNEKTMIDRRDEKKLCASIIQPAQSLHHDPSLPTFSLDVIGWYGEQVRSPSGTRWTSTIIGWWETNPYPYLGIGKVRESMQAFWNLIIYIAPNDKVHGVLWEVWNDSRRRSDMGHLEYPQVCHPTREKYWEMGLSLLKMVSSESEVDVGRS